MKDDSGAASFGLSPFGYGEQQQTWKPGCGGEEEDGLEGGSAGVRWFGMHLSN